MLLGGSNDPYGETLHSLLSLVRGKYLNIAPWEQEDTFFWTGGDDAVTVGSLLILC